MLLCASYLFYGCWDWRFLSLIAASTLVDFWIAIAIAGSTSPVRRRNYLVVSIIANLGTLAFFKYFNFFSQELEIFFTRVGWEVMVPRLNIILPVGISFYTFQTMSYAIDVYRGRLPACRNWIDFALYVAYFPQLVAGPIERATRLLPQISSPRCHRPHAFAEGLYCILFGLFKKVFVADSMAIIANGIFRSQPSELSGLEVLLGIYAFAFQIYGDFSGYSSIAQGVSKWFGIELMDNFQTPYFSTSPSEFWQRWHISLSQWLRDYVYIPLGGNRLGNMRTNANLMITMLLGGLWHGANWTYVAWGAYHGVLLCMFRLLKPAPSQSQNWPQSSWRQGIAILVFFHLVCFGWLLFRAESLQQVGSMLVVMASHWKVTPLSEAMMGMLAFYVVPLILFEYWAGQPTQMPKLLQMHWSIRAVVYAIAVHLILFLSSPTASQFIYFQF